MSRRFLRKLIALTTCTAAWIVCGIARADRSPASHMPIRSIDRPLTLLEDHFGLTPDVYVTAVRTDTLDGTKTDLVVGLFFGAGYGVTDDLEIGLTLVRLTMSPLPNTGLDAPNGYIQYRLLSGPLELAALAEMEVPINDTIEFRVATPALLHLPPVASFRVEPTLFGYFATPGSFGVRLPAELRVQFGDHVSVGGLVSATWPSLRVSSGGLLQFGAVFGYTIVRSGAAAAEIRLSGMSESFDFGDQDRLARPITSDWTVLLDATIYLRSDPDESFPDSPF